MNARTAGVLMGCLGICCVGLVFAAAYPFATTPSQAAEPASDRFTIHNTDEFRVTGQIIVDGTVEFAFTDVMTERGQRYQTIREARTTTERYHTGAGEPTYERTTLEQTEADAFIEHVTSDPDRDLLSANTTADTTTIIVATNRSPRTEVSGAAHVVLQSLRIVAYAPHPSNPTVFEPQSGWYGEKAGYRITGASGSVRVTPNTTAVNTANVTWALTTPAGSYAEYGLASMTSDYPKTYTITFSFNRTATEITRPSWVTDG